MFICIQKNQIYPSLLLYYKLAILGTLGMPGYNHKNNSNSLQKTLMFIFMRKIIFMPHLFLQILQKYCKLVVLGTLGMPGHAYQ